MYEPLYIVAYKHLSTVLLGEEWNKLPTQPICCGTGDALIFAVAFAADDMHPVIGRFNDRRWGSRGSQRTSAYFESQGAFRSPLRSATLTKMKRIPEV